jgi:hypothetical protein
MGVDGREGTEVAGMGPGTCCPSYLGGRDQEELSLRPAGQKS